MNVASRVRGQVLHLPRLPRRMPERRRGYLSRTIPLSHPIRNEIIRSKTRRFHESGIQHREDRELAELEATMRRRAAAADGGAEAARD